MIRRRTPAEAEALGPAVTDLLLLGWGAPVPAELQPDAFDIFALSQSDLLALWHQHRPTLLAEAQRRGLQQPVWAETLGRPGWPTDLDWTLARAALHGTPVPAWARSTWDAGQLARLREQLLKLLSDDATPVKDDAVE